MLPMHGDILVHEEVRAPFPAYRALKIDKIIFLSMCSNVAHHILFMRIFMPDAGGYFNTGFLVNKYFCVSCMSPKLIMI